ncbi:MAG: DUF1345 domain-containing protein [Methyloceanibacter sp.]|uniref:DUF1345 domain-containing protein n=1 Tax=Methyloceanibacter sp. TaxID=1965321 RepID=UPI003C77B698
MTTKTRKWPLLLRIVSARPRLFLSILAGFAVGALLPLYVTELRGVTRFLVAWDFGVGLYLILAFWMIAHSGVTEIHRQSLAQDEGGFAILVLTIVSACASVGAVFTWLEIATRAETFALPVLAFLLLTIMMSWAFIHTMFALHYAHEFYAEHHKTGGGLIFPRDPEPTYWDFVYLAFSIGTATQVSDVEISSKRIRRTVTLHGIVSFFFNVTVIALTVGLVGDAIQN